MNNVIESQDVFDSRLYDGLNIAYKKLNAKDWAFAGMVLVNVLYLLDGYPAYADAAKAQCPQLEAKVREAFTTAEDYEHSQACLEPCLKALYASVTI
jgi:hypothetical protein